eukprot:TRINITY_DN38183_c0_g1_i1.p1 TRINITY_DN38183_c0_g1~~TRINITY_DN38183_c0_g1_i1.p1  ORF type:complete len:111 (+),score=6.88 TRINITY_DN38183_c0_g1_i1:37-333(+)
MAFVVVALASEASEEESDAECYPAFDKSFTQEFYKAVQDCQYKPIKKSKKIKDYVLDLSKIHSNGPMWNQSKFEQSTSAIFCALLLLSVRLSGSSLCQ